MARASSPGEVPKRAVPTEYGFRPHDRDRIHSSREQLGDGCNGKPVADSQSRVGLASLQNDDLLTKHGVFGDQAGTRSEYVFERAPNRARGFANHGVRLTPEALRSRLPGTTLPRTRSSWRRTPRAEFAVNCVFGVTEWPSVK